MSGPTTVIFTAEPATVLLAAAAIRAAEAVRAGYDEADRLRDVHARQGEANRVRQAAASTAGENSLLEQVDRSEQRHAQLCRLAEPLGTAAALRATRPQRPAEASPAALAAYVRQLQALCQTLEEALLAELGEAGQVGELGLAVDEIAATTSGALPPTAAVRLLARLAQLGPLPEDIERLAAEIEATPQVDRRHLLELELRLAIQRFEEKAAQEASALVLEQTLKDLGYQVEPVSDTLFVDGGVVHFRRPGWDNYQVRLRLDAQASRANFNVLRAVDSDNCGDNERSVLDHLAEDRWCAEFPALLQALAKRGLQLDVTRRLAAGELPVQLVDRAQLPRFTDEEAATPNRAPLAKEIR